MLTDKLKLENEIEKIVPELLENDTLTIYELDEIWYATRSTSDGSLKFEYDPEEGFSAEATTSETTLLSDYTHTEGIQNTFISAVRAVVPGLLIPKRGLASA